MNETLNALIDAAAEANEAGRYPGASATINGKVVEARIVEQCRRTTGRAKQKPSVMWKVDGKRVSAADLQKATA
jgi:hypothetical protein